MTKFRSTNDTINPSQMLTKGHILLDLLQEYFKDVNQNCKNGQKFLMKFVLVLCKGSNVSQHVVESDSCPAMVSSFSLYTLDSKPLYVVSLEINTSGSDNYLSPLRNTWEAVHIGNGNLFNFLTLKRKVYK